MATATVHMAEPGTDQAMEMPLATADFQALEERVLRAVQLLKAEREAHAQATVRIQELERNNAELERHGAELERHGADLEQQLTGRAEQASRLEGELGHLQQERDHVRGRVERLLQHLDEFTA